MSSHQITSPPSRIRLSYVVTVFNKRPWIADLAASIIAQEAGPVEVVFVDDHSTDGSQEETERACASLRAAGHQTRHIRLAENCGPSVATNVGIRCAQGEWLFFIDADDMVAPGAANMMLGLAEACDADFVYGRNARFRKDLPPPTSSVSVKVSDNPLWTLLASRLVGFRFICKSHLATEGCDERVFVQDVSLPLRIARKSNRLVHISAPAIFQRQVDGYLSAQNIQERADYIAAAVYFLLDAKPEKRARVTMLSRCFRRLNVAGRRSWKTRALWFLSRLQLTTASAEQYVLQELQHMRIANRLRVGVPNTSPPIQREKTLSINAPAEQ